jgi:hypothetical protein
MQQWQVVSQSILSERCAMYLNLNGIDFFLTTLALLCNIVTFEGRFLVNYPERYVLLKDYYSWSFLFLKVTLKISICQKNTSFRRMTYWVEVFFISVTTLQFSFQSVDES